MISPLMMIVGLILITLQVSFSQRIDYDEFTDAICGLDLFDTTNLTMPGSWSFESDRSCLNTTDPNEKCTYVFSFCQSLNLAPPCNNASVCQLASNGGSTQASMFALGEYDTSIIPFVHSWSGDEGFVAMFSPGMDYYDPITKLQRTLGVMVYFDCASAELWNYENSDDALQIPGQKVVIWNSKSFTFTIRLQYAGACIKLQPIVPTLGPATVPLYLSAGTILIIIAVCCVTLYCTVGCVAKSCMGHQGVEIMPNNELWTKLPGYTRDGFMFVMTCGCCKPVRSSELTSTFKGYDSI